MNNITKLAKHIKARDNPLPYSPMFGQIISLPKLKIRLGTRVLLTKSDIKATFDIYETEVIDERSMLILIKQLCCSHTQVIINSLRLE